MKRNYYNYFLNYSDIQFSSADTFLMDIVSINYKNRRTPNLKVNIVLTYQILIMGKIDLFP